MITSRPDILKKERSLTKRITKELSIISFNGKVFEEAIIIIFDVLSWYRLYGNSDDAFVKNVPIKKLFKEFNLSQVDNMPIFEATAFIYKIIMAKYNIRSFIFGEKLEIESGDNKNLKKSDFKLQMLADIYIKSKGEVSNDFLLFDKMFINSASDDVVKMSKLSDVMNCAHISDLASKDALRYKIGVKSLDVKVPRVVKGEKKELIVIQDASSTMKMYEEGLIAVKSFIIDEAFREDFRIKWLYVTNQIHKEENYSKKSFAGLFKYDEYFKRDVDLTSILASERFRGKNVVIITDGTDDFKMPIRMVTDKVHLVYFIDNTTLTNKFDMYGKCFKAFNSII